MKSRAIILFVAAVTLRAVAATYYVSDAIGVDAKGGDRAVDPAIEFHDSWYRVTHNLEAALIPSP